jgi:hypothetical protein
VAPILDLQHEGLGVTLKPDARPYYLAPDGSPEVRMGPDEIRVTFLAQSVEFATAYAAVGRYDDVVAKADAALAGLTPTQDNLEVRFYGLLTFMTASQVAGDFERAERQHDLAMRLHRDAHYLPAESGQDGVFGEVVELSWIDV